MAKLAIVFDGPPGPIPGRFVEVELDGAGISFGKWEENGNLWELVLPDPHTQLAVLVEVVNGKVRELAAACSMIEQAITFDGGLDGAVGERFLREMKYWPESAK